MSAEDAAAAHVERARKHYGAFLAHHARTQDPKDELLKIMKDQFSIFAGRISVDDCAVISAQIGNDHYRYALRERDEKIGVLLKERNALRRQVAELQGKGG